MFYSYSVYNVVDGVYQGKAPHHVLLDIPAGTEADLTGSAVGGREDNNCFFTKAGNLLSWFYHELYDGQTGALIAFRPDVPSLTEARFGGLSYSGGGIYFADLDGDNFRKFVENKPPAPTGLTATPTSSAQIVLGWTDTSGDASGFRIERKDGVCASTNTWAKIAVKGGQMSQPTPTQV